MIELITISQAGQTWYLNKIIVNPKYVSTVSESQEHSRLLSEGKINLGLGPHVVFSKVMMAVSSGFGELVVVGSPTNIMEKINKNTKQLLKG